MQPPSDSCCASSALPVWRENAWKSRTALRSVVTTHNTCPLSICARAFLARRMGRGQVRPLASTSISKPASRRPALPVRPTHSSETLFHPLLHAGDRRRQAAASVPPPMAMSGRPPPLPPTWPATKPTRSPALDAAGQVGRDAAHHADLAFGAGRQQHNRGLQAILEVVDHAAQGLGIDVGDAGGQDLDALDLDRGAGRQVVAGAGGQLAARLLQVFSGP